MGVLYIPRAYRRCSNPNRVGLGGVGGCASRYYFNAPGPRQGFKDMQSKLPHFPEAWIILLFAPYGLPNTNYRGIRGVVDLLLLGYMPPTYNIYYFTVGGNCIAFSRMVGRSNTPGINTRAQGRARLYLLYIYFFCFSDSHFID